MRTISKRIYGSVFSPTPPSVLFKAMLAAEIFGLAGVVAGSSWGFLKDRRAILAIQAFATVMFGIHYGLLGAWSGAAMCVMTLVQATASLPQKRTRATTILFWSTVPMIAVLTVPDLERHRVGGCGVRHGDGDAGPLAEGHLQAALVLRAVLDGVGDP